MKRITTDKQRSIFAEYKEEMQQVINEKAAALKELNNHIFQEPKENPLEKFCDAQEKEINDLKKLVESLQGRIIAMDKLAQMSDKWASNPTQNERCISKYYHLQSVLNLGI